MVEAARPSPIPDSQGSDAGTQNTSVNNRVARLNSEERAVYLVEKLLQQQSFYQAAKLESAHKIRSPEERRNPMLRRNEILERVLVGGENCATIAASYGKDETWALSEFKVGLIRLWRKSSLQLQEKFPEEAIIPDRSDTRRRKTQGREDDLVGQLQREDISSKEELEELMGRVNYIFYLKHRNLLVNLRDLIRKQNFQTEDGYSNRVVQMTSDLLTKEGMVIRQLQDKNGGDNIIHLIWSGDLDDAIELLDQYIRATVEASIS